MKGDILLPILITLGGIILVFVGVYLDVTPISILGIVLPCSIVAPLLFWFYQNKGKSNEIKRVIIITTLVVVIMGVSSYFIMS